MNPRKKFDLVPVLPREVERPTFDAFREGRVQDDLAAFAEAPGVSGKCLERTRVRFEKGGERAIDESEPKYKLPAGFHKSVELFNLMRTRNPQHLDRTRRARSLLPAGFHKSVELFNLHRAIGQNDDRGRVVVVEGFFDCLKVHQAGFPAVALMGCSLSENQEELLARHFKAVCLLLDGDEAGRNATDEILLRLGKRMWTRAWMLPDGLQPDQLDVERIAQILGA